MDANARLGHSFSQSSALIMDNPEDLSENQGPAIIIVSTVMCTLCAITVVLRFIARWRIRAPIQWDDWLCIPALLLVICMGVECGISVPVGLGKHAGAINPLNGWKLIRIGFWLSLTYTLVHLLIKLSILLFYIRVFTLHLKWFRYAVYAALFYVVGWSVSIIIYVPLQCQPMSFYWNRFKLIDQPPGVCPYSLTAPPIATGVLNSVGDVIVLTLPVFVLNGLQLRARKKMALISVFLVGCFTCLAGFIRLIFICRIANVNIDLPWVTGDMYLWTMIEAAVGLMCACFPALWPLIRGFIEAKKTSTRLRDNYSNPSATPPANTIITRTTTVITRDKLKVGGSSRSLIGKLAEVRSVLEEEEDVERGGIGLGVGGIGLEGLEGFERETKKGYEVSIYGGRIGH